MRFQTPLVPARLIRRYKRFLSDMVLEESGVEVVAHCPNPGAMLGLAAEGTRCWLEPNNDPRKKLDYGWRLSELPEGGGLVGIDTSLPNRIVGEALRAGGVPGLEGYHEVRAEVPYGTRSRVDFLLRGAGVVDLYLEVKNVHLCRKRGLAEFPDCVTARGARHLDELAGMVAAGQRAVMLYLVQRGDCTGFAVAGDLDPTYAERYRAARAAGVEVMAFDCTLSREEITLGASLPIS